MSIRDIQISKDLRKFGSKLGRAGLSELALKVAKEMIEDGSYKRAIAGAGELHAIALAARYDSYWDEKSCKGFQDGYYRLSKAAAEKDEASKGDGNEDIHTATDKTNND